MARTQFDLIQSLVHENTIQDERITYAMLATDRFDFSTGQVYEDAPQSIGYNVTISAPHMHAFALELLRDKLVPGARVLDVGSGSGYLTLCMARLVYPTGKVFGIEHIPQLVHLSLTNIAKNGRSFLDDGTLEIVLGDGRFGYPQGGPYDAIHVGAAASHHPIELINQLNPGGRLVVPVGIENQRLMIYEKSLDGCQVHEQETMGVNYVPLTDKNEQWPY
ncbi:unnamed protein product [Rotaria sp. Silwood2]|nr:unnamed protein product [Rotaria sp. Silwood2]CAF2882358.1 unnamed protein product [Rotaria sp. Silwood2]CAF3034094.1 unnamed protein product [Rotaria sp. Silwood2]CAF3987071.1 unnamed protein product [Rotaria sp. Silwood2]CAF4013942.1 unnamed protein product [Rotaria sp. Silwood2]